MPRVTIQKKGKNSDENEAKERYQRRGKKKKNGKKEIFYVTIKFVVRAKNKKKRNEEQNDQSLFRMSRTARLSLLREKMYAIYLV